MCHLPASGPAGADSRGRRQLPDRVWEATGERPGHQGACTPQAVQVETLTSHTQPWAHTCTTPPPLCAHRYDQYLCYCFIYSHIISNHSSLPHYMPHYYITYIYYTQLNTVLHPLSVHLRGFNLQTEANIIEGCNRMQGQRWLPVWNSISGSSQASFTLPPSPPLHVLSSACLLTSSLCVQWSWLISGVCAILIIVDCVYIVSSHQSGFECRLTAEDWRDPRVFACLTTRCCRSVLPLAELGSVL